MAGGFAEYLAQVRADQEREKQDPSDLQHAPQRPPEPPVERIAVNCSCGDEVEVVSCDLAPAVAGLRGRVVSVDTCTGRCVVNLPEPHGKLSLKAASLRVVQAHHRPGVGGEATEGRMHEPQGQQQQQVSSPVTSAASPVSPDGGGRSTGSGGKYVPPSQRGRQGAGDARGGQGDRNPWGRTGAPTGGSGGGTAGTWGGRAGYTKANPPPQPSGSSLADRMDGTLKAPLEPALERRAPATGGGDVPEWRDGVQHQVVSLPGTAGLDKAFKLPPPEEIRCSKIFAWILRHGAQKASYRMTADGFVRVSDILAREQGLHQYQQFTEGHVRWMVAHNDKQRFRLSERDDVLWIAASQGHSDNLGLGTDHLNPITDPKRYPRIVHGTFYDKIDQIMKSGLLPMGRQHVHFCEGDPGKNPTIRGLRRNAEVLIYVDLPMAMDDGMKFFTAANGVVLTSGNADHVVPPRYFRSVLHAATQEPYRKGDW